MKEIKDINSTKRKILDCAVNLFAVKGFTETSVRELAASAGISVATLYFYFPTKNAILEYILTDYSEYSKKMIADNDVFMKLKKNPTLDGIMACFVLTFPEDKKEYNIKVLSVILQEQHRNIIIRDFITKEIILRDEENVKKIINVLKELNVLRPDTDPDFWFKMSSSLFYSFSNRMLLGIGDMSPGFTGAGLSGTLRFLFELMLKYCGADTDIC